MSKVLRDRVKFDSVGGKLKGVLIVSRLVQVTYFFLSTISKKNKQ